MIENKFWDRIGVALTKQKIDPGNVIDVSCPKCRICGTGKEEPKHIMTDCEKLQTLRLNTFGHHKPEPPYTKIKVYQLVAFLKVINLPSLEMKPFLEQYNPTSIPDEARPDPPPPIVEGAEMVSSDSEDDSAVQRAAEAAGGKLLHNYLVTSNKPPLPPPRGDRFY